MEMTEFSNPLEETSDEEPSSSDVDDKKAKKKQASNPAAQAAAGTAGVGAPVEGETGFIASRVGMAVKVALSDE